MRSINGLLDSTREIVRSLARSLARFLNTVTKGTLTPDMVTITSLLGHLPIAWLIATRHFIWAAGLLVIFGLMDTLDGELARLQKKASSAGMVLDASTDRMKESLLYIAVAYAFVDLGRPHMAAWAVAACAGALIVSYIKAKGETAIAGKMDVQKANRFFQDGLMRYEVRMFVLVVGLLSGRLILAVIVLAVLAWITATGRLIRITRFLHAQG